MLEEQVLSEKEVSGALFALLVVLEKEDKEKGREGQAAHYFWFYDVGLARIAEILEQSSIEKPS